MTLFKRQNKPALILIDMQKGFEDIKYWGGGRNNPGAEKVAEKILHYWRKKQLPIFHIKHCSADPNSKLAAGQVGNDFIDELSPLDAEIIVEKNVNSAFIGTNLKQLLDDAKIKQLVIVGLTTDHCVSTTSRMAGNFGYDVLLVSDATATFDKVGFDGRKYSAEVIHDTALASLHNEFVRVVHSSDIILG